MRRIFAIFRNRLFIGLLGLGCVALLIWYVGPLIAIHRYTPLAEPLVRWLVIGGCAGFWLINNLRRKLRLQSLHEAFKSRPRPMPDPEDQRADEELRTLNERFDEAMKLLRGARGSKSRVDLYELPWYIIIGPPGSGKTTALVKSGLKFPLEDTLGRSSVKGVGGTRNCDWWFTEEAVLIDTAGRYTTQDSHQRLDQSAWQGFLSLLKKHRPRQPINGAIVAISATDLQQNSDHEREQHVARIRQRLRELKQTLEIDFPVYVLLTKLDLLAGFTEFFENFGPGECQQVWGFTLSRLEAGDSVAMLAEQEFEALLARLDGQKIQRLEQEPGELQRLKIFAFPQQLAALKAPLGEFLAGVFQADRYHPAQMLRGVYLTSATQEGTPLDRVLGRMAGNFGDSPNATVDFAGRGRSYFVRDTFEQLIFKEAYLAGPNTRLEKSRRWLQRSAYAATAVVVVAMALLWLTSFTHNQLQIKRFGTALAELESQARSTPPAGGSLPALRDHLNRLQALTDAFANAQGERVPWSMRMGLYQGNRVAAAMDAKYQQEVERVLLPALQKEMEGYLARPDIDPDLYYETLKAYLMLNRQEMRDSKLIHLWAAHDWRQRLPEDPRTRGQMLAHLEVLLARPFRSSAPNADLVNGARRHLQRRPLAQLMYGRLKRDYVAVKPEMFTLESVLGSSGAEVFAHRNDLADDDSVSMFFSKDGYYEHFKPKLLSLADMARREAWVLSDEKTNLTDTEVDALTGDLHQLYLREYIARWDDFLADLKIASFTNLTQTTQVLGLLSQVNSPMRSLLDAIGNHLQLTRESRLEKVTQRLPDQVEQHVARIFNADEPARESSRRPERIVDDHFAGLLAALKSDEQTAAPIASVYELLAQLFTYFDGLANGVGSPVGALTTRGESADVITRVRLAARNQPEPVASWMQQIATQSRAVVYGGVRHQINEQWQAGPQITCTRLVAGRYPFRKSSATEISVADFSRLFAPGGLLDSFFAQHLQALVEIKNGRWQWRSEAGVELGFADSTLVQFQRAARIRDMFFPARAQTPEVHFRLKPIYLDANVSGVDLEIDGQRLRYRHGPTRAMPVSWPGPEAGLTRLSFEDTSGLHAAATVEGTWSWFRLLDRAEVQARSNENLLVTLAAQGRQSQWQLLPASVLNPFVADELRRFQCPGSL